MTPAPRTSWVDSSPVSWSRQTAVPAGMTRLCPVAGVRGPVGDLAAPEVGTVSQQRAAAGEAARF
jgi:hypothetical protein